jgi:Putative zinc- or iron-chelating domain
LTECNGCGACCDPVTLPVSSAQLATMGSRLTDGDWMREHLHPIPRREGRARQAWAKGRGWNERIDEHGDPVIEAVFYYGCDRYDPVAKRCTDYEGRPGMCRDYPWHTGAPIEGADLPPTCSYRADIGLPVEGEVTVAAPTRKARPRGKPRGSRTAR